MEVRNLVCITTFRQGDPNNEIERTRTEVFLSTVNAIVEAGFHLVTVYVDTQQGLIEWLGRLGVILVRQQSKGMGNVRREALMAAMQCFPDTSYFCWLEPEKPDIIRFLATLAQKMEQEKSALGLFSRIDMASYPPEQGHYYLFCRAVASYMVGFDIDYAFGPMMMTSQAVTYFLRYQGEYGDKWDSILIPRLRTIRDGHIVSMLPINFQNDSKMTSVESGNRRMILKRLEQLNNVIPSLVAEWEKLTSDSFLI